MALKGISVTEEDLVDAAKPPIEFTKEPCPDGRYEMTIFAIRAKTSNAGNVYAEVSLKHTGEFKRFPFANLRLNDNAIGKRQLIELTKSVEADATGIGWSYDDEVVDQYGRMQAEFTRNGDIVSKEFIGKLVTVDLVTKQFGEGRPKNEVNRIVVPKAEQPLE
jgi:hypothetical protein